MSNAAVIIEPRPMFELLKMVIQNAIDELGPEWPIIFYHGTKNVSTAKKIKEFFGECLTLRNCGHHNFNAHTYSSFMMNTSFWKNIPAENILIFQTDSWIIPQSKFNIKNFLSYDYVGAPWRDGTVGNGGFSFRKRSAMMKITQTCTKKHMHEDAWFSINLRKRPYKLAPLKVAENFATETVWKDMNNVPYGMHNCWRYLPKTTWDKLVEICPDLLKLKTLNLGYSHPPGFTESVPTESAGVLKRQRQNILRSRRRTLRARRYR